jgi:hypothetical protein
MKLFELSGIKDYAKMSGGLLIKMLIRKGVIKKTLGKGTYGMAFELSSGEVLKVWANDGGFEEYIKYCSKNQSNPYLIKVHGKVTAFEMKSAEISYPQGMKFVRVEQLEIPMSLKQFGYGQADKNKSEQFLQRFMDYIIHEGNDGELLEGEARLKHFGLDPKKSSDKFEKFLDAATEICMELRHTLGLELDLSLGNFGMRGEQPVFLDPVIDAFGVGDEPPLEINKVLGPMYHG